jgi:predicted PurR-regulated permease PerM
MPAPIRDQSVELFHVVEGALIKYLETRLLLREIEGDLGWTVAYFTFGGYALPIGLWVVIGEITLVLGAVPAVLTALFSGGLEGDILVALFLLLAQQLEGNVLVLRIMGSSFGVPPLLVLFATLAVMVLYVLGAVFVVPVAVIIALALRYLRRTLLFEHWHLLPVVEVVVERAPGLAASSKELAGLRVCSTRGEG